MSRLLLAVMLVQATFSTRTDLVVVPVFVTDAAGNAVTDLPREAFRIYDEGRLQPIQTFYRGEVPATVGLLVDHSQSMLPNRTLVIAGVSAFVKARRLDDELFLFPFNDLVTTQLFDGRPFGRNEQLTEPLVNTLPAGSTALYDAVIEGLTRVAMGSTERRALVIISDGGDNASKHDYDDAVDAVRRSSVVVYAVGLPAPGEDRRSAALLQRLCAESGGFATFTSSASATESVLDTIGHDLRQQYTLGFAPNGAKRGLDARKIKVTVSAPGRNVRVRTRAAYLGS